MSRIVDNDLTRSSFSRRQDSYMERADENTLRSKGRKFLKKVSSRLQRRDSKNLGRFYA